MLIDGQDFAWDYLSQEAAFSKDTQTSKSILRQSGNGSVFWSPLMDSQCRASTGVFVPFNKGAFFFFIRCRRGWGRVNGWPISISGRFCVGKSRESNCRKTSWGIGYTLRWRKRHAEVVVVYRVFFPPVCSPFSVSWVDVVVGFMFGIRLQTNALNPTSSPHPAHLLFHWTNGRHCHLCARTYAHPRTPKRRPFG